MNAPLSFAPILAQARDSFRDSLCRAVGAMFDGAEAALEGHADREREPEARNRWLDARDHVCRHRPAIEGRFRARFDREFQKLANLGAEMAPPPTEYHAEDMELVGEDDLEETLRFDDMAERLRGYCEEELSALDQRVGVLMGDATLAHDKNPLGPKGVCRAFKVAVKEGDAPLATRLVLVRLFDDHVLDTIRASYREVNEHLASNGILPRIRYSIARHEAPSVPAVAPAAPMPTVENAEDVFAMLRGLLGGGASVASGAPASAMGVGGIALLHGGQLQLSLKRLQLGDLNGMGAASVELAPIVHDAGSRNVLHELKDTSVGAALDATDGATLDIVAMLFDEIFDDDHIPEALKSLMGRLQLPILRVALADKDLFTDRKHPARQLIDVLGRIGLRLPADFDKSSPLFAKLKAFIEDLDEGFRDKLDIFDEVRARLEGLVAEEAARIAKVNEAPRREMDEAEVLGLAKSAAEEAVRSRVERADHPPQVVVEFLTQQWLKFLLTVHARDRGQGPAWEAALKVVDDLLWSVAAKDPLEARREVAHAIPGLLKALKAGVAEAGIAPTAVSGFFILLMKRHTEVIHGAPLREKPTPVAFSEKVTVKSPFGGAEVDVSTVDLDFTKPGALPGTPSRAPSTPQPPILLPAKMVEGAWVETLHPFSGEPTFAQLHYVSPLGSHYLFVDRQGRKVFECSRAALSRHLKEGKVTLLPGEPGGSLFDRTIDGIVSKMRVAA